MTCAGTRSKPIGVIAPPSSWSTERPNEIRLALEPARPVPLMAMGLQFLGGRSFAKDAFGLKISAR